MEQPIIGKVESLVYHSPIPEPSSIWDKARKSFSYPSIVNKLSEEPCKSCPGNCSAVCLQMRSFLKEECENKGSKFVEETYPPEFVKKVKRQFPDLFNAPPKVIPAINDQLRAEISQIVREELDKFAKESLDDIKRDIREIQQNPFGFVPFMQAQQEQAKET